MTVAAVATSHSLVLPPARVGDGLLGAIGAMRRDPLGFLRSTATLGDVVRFRLPQRDAVLIRHPDDVKRVLVDNVRNYGKQTRGFDRLRLFLRNGLLTSEGEFWRRQRRIAQPAFHRQRLATFANTMTQCTSSMLERWQTSIASGVTVDVAHEMMRLTLRIAGLTLLSTDVERDAEQVGDAVTVANRFALKTLMSVYNPPLWLPTPSNREFRRAARVLDDVVDRVVSMRRRTGTGGDDLLAMLMEARDEETGEGMTDAQLRDEVMTMFLAGHETTANALAWTFYLIALHPHVETKLRDEIARVLGTRTANFEDLQHLTYTKMVVKEAMRLYPPAWIAGRNAIENDVLGNCHVARGSIVFLSAYLTHRHPDFWPAPEAFDPERFTAEREDERPRLAYMPFGAGPRMCIGNNFAMMEAQLIVASVLQGVRMELVAQPKVVPEPVVTLRPRDGVPMRLHGA